ncbi:hypothetical protein H9Q72_003108 [Fusarium xylarioides]|uniref:AAA+ ATPase domain-containing protein n=1 Tax=Fusarium xylarioides TaxID=221167 RepID=A0A9P7L9X7_9HYPO|nr:hypothetical protein H9Q70_008723 [Fusarium xylarioides]KAG5769703.1 hypothetical protein H9Q72_003108 [Fusarium xylarioides]
MKMADSLSIASSVAALAVFALKSSTVLYTTIRDFQSQDKSARALKNELADLRGVLQSLAETVDNNGDSNFDVLKLPLLRCGKTCEEYGELIARRTATSITPNVLEEYKDMIRDTTNDLQEHMTRLEERVQGLTASEAKRSVGKDSAWLAILEEKQSTQEGLKICSRLSAQVERLGIASAENPQSLPHSTGLTMFSFEIAQTALLDDGFIDLEDATVGDTVWEMEKRQFPYLTPFGLKYCKQHILEDERIRAIVESSLGECTLGHWLRYRALPGHIECFRGGGKQAGLRVLVVQQFCRGSQVEIWHGSHLHDLPVTDGIRSLYETTRHELQKAGCTAELKKFQSGGLNFLDPQTKLWYAKRSIPYRRGYLLFGPPGTGKSSFSLSIAGELDLDIYVISIPSVNDQTLKDLFDGLPDRCVVLLEDIDAAGATRSRDLRSEDSDSEGDTGPRKKAVTLSGLLNTLDGVASQEDRILIMTTNHVGKLDEALIRPGRVDFKVEFRLADRETAEQLFYFVLGHQEQGSLEGDQEWDSDLQIEEQAAEFAAKVPDLKFSSAEIVSYLVRYRDYPAAAIENCGQWVDGLLKEKEAKEEAIKGCRKG